MSGATRLNVSEMSIKNKNLKGEAYLKSVENEMVKENQANEGSEQDNVETSDKLFKIKNIGV